MLVLIFFAVVFFSVYMQSGLSVLLFTERSVDLELFGHRVPPSDVQSLNPLFILLLAPVFSWAWLRMTRHGRGPSIPFKFALGMLFIGLAFLVLRMGGLATGAEHKVALGWMVLFFLLYTAGEMSLSPVGLAMVSAWAPKRLAGFAMGMWLLSISAASYISGIVANIAAVPPGTGEAEQRQIYETAFTEFGLMALGVTLLLFALVPVLKRMIHR
jgi:POT family proton-dependent oligopeptide transporter